MHTHTHTCTPESMSRCAGRTARRASERQATPRASLRPPCEDCCLPAALCVHAVCASPVTRARRQSEECGSSAAGLACSALDDRSSAAISFVMASLTRSGTCCRLRKPPARPARKGDAAASGNAASAVGLAAPPGSPLAGEEKPGWAAGGASPAASAAAGSLPSEAKALVRASAEALRGTVPPPPPRASAQLPKSDVGSPSALPATSLDETTSETCTSETTRSAAAASTRPRSPAAMPLRMRRPDSDIAS